MPPPLQNCAALSYMMLRGGKGGGAKQRAQITGSQSLFFRRDIYSDIQPRSRQLQGKAINIPINNV